MDYLISIVLIAFSALFSGLTLGLMSLDVQTLKRKAELKDKQARRVLRVRERGNLLLTTLLLGNVAVNAILAIYLGSIASGLLASLLATGLIFLFGEIIPQAIISRHALAFGARTAWLVRLLIILLFPIAGLIAWILDKTLGAEVPSVYSRHELLKVIEEHEDSNHSDIDEDEERIIKGALTYSTKKASDVMTPRSVLMMLEMSQRLTPALVKQMRDAGYSRFPVYDQDENDIVGILYAKDLLGRKLSGKHVKDFMDRKVYAVHQHTKLDEVLNAFLKTKHHMFVVLDEFETLVGILTVEDIIEEIVGVEIVDEFDVYTDMQEVAKRRVKK